MKRVVPQSILDVQTLWLLFSKKCFLSGTTLGSASLVNDTRNIILHFLREAQENIFTLSGVTSILQPSARLVLLSCVVLTGDIHHHDAYIL